MRASSPSVGVQLPWLWGVHLVTDRAEKRRQGVGGRMISAALFSGAASDYFAADQQAPSYTMLAGHPPRAGLEWAGRYIAEGGVEGAMISVPARAGRVSLRRCAEAWR